ncbi:hypothetical protein JZU68_07410, partial [bacterium]|nr:hypothetical protein [bacterium]
KPTQRITVARNEDHTFVSAGTYTVSISGTLTQFGSSDVSQEYLTKCLSFGNLGLSNLNYAFMNASSLTEVPTTLPSIY